MQASTDTEKWLASHLEGKQHLGYLRVRQTAEQLQKKKEDERGARQRQHDAAEKPVEAETKSKIDKVITERTKESDKLFQVAHRMVIVLLTKAGSGIGIVNTAEARRELNREAAVQITAMIMRQRERGKEKETRRGIGVIMTERKTDIMIMTGVKISTGRGTGI